MAWVPASAFAVSGAHGIQGVPKKSSEVFNVSSIKLLAALSLVAASLAWVPASHAGASFSFGFATPAHL